MRPSALDRVFLAFASDWATFVLVAAVGGFLVLGGVIPQGDAALARLLDPNERELRRLAGLGLTELYASDWLFGLLVLLAGNLVAKATSLAYARWPDRPPAAGALRRRFATPHADVAVEVARELLSARLGPPVDERGEGHKASLVFQAGRRRRLAPVVGTLGLVLAFLGAAELHRSRDEVPRLARAILDIEYPARQTSGRFDMALGESFQLFDLESRYVVRGYLESRNALGPAVRIERIPPRRDRGTEFWVYLNAPPGFDARHRKGEVAITAVSLGLVPMPGHGITGSAGGLFVLFGLALLGLSLFGARDPAARVFLAVDGAEVEVAAVGADPAELAGRFEVWATLLESTLAPAPEGAGAAAG